MKKIINSLYNNLTPGLIKIKGLSISQEKKEKFYNYLKEELLKLKGNDFPHPNFKRTRELYKNFKIDPTKYRPSSEALWRRFKKKGEFPKINPIVDLINIFSLKFQISCGLYDLNKIKGDIHIKIGKEEDFYQGIRKKKVSLKGKIVLKDALGAFGNPSSDSLRTSVTNDSENIIIFIFFSNNFKEVEMESFSTELKKIFEKFFTIRSISLKIPRNNEIDF